MRIFTLILIPVLLSGCKHSVSSDKSATKLSIFVGHAPTKLAARIADADNIYVTSCFAPLDKEHRDMRFLIKGATVRNIVRAVSSSGSLDLQVGNIPSWHLEFKKGTNFLDFIVFEGHTFNCEYSKRPDGGWQYNQCVDGTGVLEKLDAELTKLAKPTTGP